MRTIRPVLASILAFLRAYGPKIFQTVAVLWTVKEVVVPGVQATQNLSNSATQISNAVTQGAADVNQKIDQAANLKLPGFPGGAVGLVVAAGVLGFILFVSEDK